MTGRLCGRTSPTLLYGFSESITRLCHVLRILAQDTYRISGLLGLAKEACLRRPVLPCPLVPCPERQRATALDDAGSGRFQHRRLAVRRLTKDD